MVALLTMQTTYRKIDCESTIIFIYFRMVQNHSVNAGDLNENIFDCG